MSLGHGASIVRNGLVLHLDAANVKSYPGSGTAWNDLSRNGNTGTLTNGPVYNSGNNGSFVFDSVNDYVALPQLSGASTTISIWFNTNNTSKTDQGLFTRNQGNLFQLNGSSGFTWWPDVTTSPYSVSKTISANTWYCVSVTQEGTICYMYLNGVEIGNNQNTIAFRQTYSNNLSMIGTYGGGARFFSGNISNVSVYSRVLSSIEIKQNFEALRGRYGI